MEAVILVCLILILCVCAPWIIGAVVEVGKVILCAAWIVTCWVGGFALLAWGLVSLVGGA